MCIGDVEEWEGECFPIIFRFLDVVRTMRENNVPKSRRYPSVPRERPPTLARSRSRYVFFRDFDFMRLTFLDLTICDLVYCALIFVHFYFFTILTLLNLSDVDFLPLDLTSIDLLSVYLLPFEFLPPNRPREFC